LRATVLENPDATMTAAIVNHGAKRVVTIGGWDSVQRPVRVYSYDSAAPSLNPFGDLPGPVETVSPAGGEIRVEVPEKGMVFLTTDYQDRKPSAVTKVRIVNGKLGWAANEEPEHCYYRVYKDGKQIASTVATSLDLGGCVSSRAAAAGDSRPPETDPFVFSVTSVDKWGNEGK